MKPYALIGSTGARRPGLLAAAARRALALAGLACVSLAAAAAADSFLGRPIYSEPASGLQLPPGCQVDPSWRSAVAGTDLEIWIALCTETPRVWLLRRQVLEVVEARLVRLRFEVIDEHAFPEETAGETLSVQCTGPSDEAGYVVRGARWRSDGKGLRLRNARGVLRVDTRAQTLVESEIGAVDCARFPEREAMMKSLQKTR